MIQQHIRPIPTHRAREAGIRERALGTGAQADVAGRVGGEVVCAVDPEAEEGVGAGGVVVDEDLGDVDVADEGLVGGGGGVGGEGWWEGSGGCGGGVGVCEGEGGGVGDLFGRGERGDEDRLYWWEGLVSVLSRFWIWMGKEGRTYIVALSKHCC